MYLTELMDKALLCEDPVQDKHVVLCNKGVCPWCDIPLVVTVVDWEGIYTKYRAQEPDIELVFPMFMSTPSAEFLQEFANSDAVRARYEQLRLDLDAQAEAASEEAEATNHGGGETPMDGDFMQGEFMNPELQGDFAKPRVEDSIGGQVTPPAVRVEQTAEPAMEGVAEVAETGPAVETLTLTEGPETVVNLSPSYEAAVAEANSVFDSPFMVTAEETGGASFGSLGTGDDAPAMVIVPPTPVPESEAPAVSQPESEPAEEPAVPVAEEPAVVEESVPVVETTMPPENPQAKLVAYLQAIKDGAWEIADAADWAVDCADSFNTLRRDYSEVLKTVPLGALFSSNGTTAADFLNRLANLNWGSPDTDEQVTSLETVEQFMHLLSLAYQDALKFCCYSSQEKAVALAKLFASLIYEE